MSRIVFLLCFVGASMLATTAFTRMVKNLKCIEKAWFPVP
jgi:hypothetical protein